MIKESPILVTGIPRSGSSMIAAALNLYGAFGGVMTQGEQSLKRGMYENVEIRDQVVKKYLVDAGVDIMGQFPLLDTDEMLIPRDWKNQVESLLLAEGYTEGKWMYKDARSILIWPIWNYAYPDAKWVIVRRRTGDILDSCMKTGFMTAFKKEENRKMIGVANEKSGWLWWVHQYEKRIVELISEGVNCKVIWPERMVNGDYKQLMELCDWLDLKWNDDSLSYINTLLWGNKTKKEV
jgi:hypothetical protein